jgi:hypothetical protein
VLYTLVSGCKRSVTVKECKNGQMVPIIRVNGRMIWPTALGSSFMKTGMSTKESGEKISHMGLEYIPMPMVQSMTVNGTMISSTGKEWKLGPMEQGLRAHSWVEPKKGLVYCILQMGHTMKESSKITRLMESACTSGWYPRTRLNRILMGQRPTQASG